MVKYNIVILSIVVLGVGLVPAPVAGQQVCDDPTNETIQNNTTVRDLCQRLGNISDERAEFRRKAIDRQDRITELRSEKTRLQNQLEEAEDRVDVEDQARQDGAWHPDVQKDQIATLVLRVQRPGSDAAGQRFGLFQYVGPGNGQYDFNADGRKAWTEIPIQQAGDTPLGPVRIELEYALPGMNRTYEFSQANAKTEIQRLENRMNSPEGYMAWTSWVNREYNETKQLNLGSQLGATMVSVLLGLLGIMWEAKNGRVRRWLNRRKRSRSAEATYTDLLRKEKETSSLIDRLREVFR
jgi:hypothetical protein